MKKLPMQFESNWLNYIGYNAPPLTINFLMPINRVYDNFDYFDALFENTQQNSVLLIQPDGIIAAINTAFSGNFGYTNPDIIGKKKHNSFY